MKQLMGLKYQDGNLIVEHLSMFKDLLNQLGAVQISFNDKVQALILIDLLHNNQENQLIYLVNLLLMVKLL